mgnify:CR=1 FL=1
MSTFLSHLFGFENTETRGERYFAYVFEAFVALCTLKYAWGWAVYVQKLSDVVLPLGIAQYIDVSLFFGGWAYGAAALLTVCVLLGFSRYWRYGYVVALLLLHLLFTARYSQGEIPHSSNVLGMTLMGFGLGLAAFDAERLRLRFAIGFTYFFVGFGYSISFFCKMIGTGPDWVDGHHLQLWMHEKSVDMFARTGAFDFTFAQSVALDHYWVATAFLTIGAVTELLAFSMWWPRFRVPAVLAVLGLHAGIYLTMRIVFPITTVELILLALPWACIAVRVLPGIEADEKCPFPHFRAPPSTSDPTWRDMSEDRDRKVCA